MPLAAAVSAHAASVTLPTSNFTCSDDSGFGSGSCTSGSGVSQTSGGGLSFYLSSGGVLLAGDGSLTESSHGSVSGAIASGASIPYTIDIGLSYFTLDPNYSLEVEVLDTTTDKTLVDSTFSGSYGISGATISDSGSFTAMNGSSGGNTIEVEFTLTLSNVPGNGRTTVTIPEGESVDIGPITSASTPEPASIGLMGAGLAWLGFQWRKRRKS
jgi:hypothetical protein